ncbi:S8 family serine peptidase [bacterium]|nr:S8 family serine peptidase [bacterium]
MKKILSNINIGIVAVLLSILTSHAFIDKSFSKYPTGYNEFSSQSPSTVSYSRGYFGNNEDNISFRYAKLGPSDPLPAPIVSELAADGFKRNFGYYIVKFDGETTEERKNRIISIAKDTPLGARTFYYVPNAAWIFRLSNDVVNEIENLDFIERVAPLIPSFRVLPSLINEKQEPDSVDGMVKIIIQIFQDDDYLALAEILRGMDVQMVDVTRGAHHEYILLKTSPARVREIAIIAALFEGTEWVERRYPNRLYNDWSRWITQSSNFTGMTSGSRLYAQMSVDLDHVPIYRRGLYGQGQLVGYLDTGLDTNSIYFCDPGIPVAKTIGWTVPTETNHRKIRAYNHGTISSGDFDDIDDTMHGHGTHVGGSIAGENEANSPTSGTYNAGDGMAPLARLVFTDGADGTSGIWTPTDMNTLFGYTRNCGAYLHSNSYGSDSPTYYNTNAQECDEFMWDYKDFLIFFAAGNDNSSTPVARVASYGVAKNIVTVGATESGSGWNYETWTNPGSDEGNDPENMAEFSSHGPTDEGLMKPNVCTPGGWYIFSADNIDGGSSCHTGMTFMGGTSMATPICAGMTALIRQYFMAGYYPTGDAVSGDALTPSGALMKAMLILGTRNMTGSWTISATNNSGHQDAPSNGQGWGRVVLDDCMYFNDSYGSDTRKLWLQDVSSGFTSTGQTHTYWLNTGTSTTENFKVVLSFTDYPGSPAVGTSGVNDLNLSVTVDGNAYKGNVFASSGSRSITGGSYDGIDRDEVVWLDPIPNSLVEITVTANVIRTSGQTYALAVAGDISEGEPNATPGTPGLTYNLFDNERTPDRTPTIEWLVPVDDDGDALHFKFQWDDTLDFSTPLGEAATNISATGFTGGPFPVTEGTTALKSYTFQSNLTQGETYWWRVCSYDGTSYSPWTTMLSFTVDTFIDPSDWFQTINQQFTRGTPSGVEIASDKVHVAGMTILFEDDFESYSSQAEFEAEWTTSGTASNCNYSWQTAASHSSSHSIRIYDASSWRRAYFGHTFTALSSGFISVWSGVTSSSDEGEIIRMCSGNFSTRKGQLYYREGYVIYWDGSNRDSLQAIDTGSWHKFMIDFDSGSNEIYVTIDDTSTYGPYTYENGAGTIDRIVCGAYLENSYTGTIYWDDFIIGQDGGAGNGTLISPPIVFDWNSSLDSWNAVNWTQNTGDDIEVVCEERVSGSWIPRDSATTATATGAFDISSLADADTIRLRAKLAVAGSVEPDMFDWSVSWTNLSSIGIEIRKGGVSGPLYSTTEWTIGRLDEGQAIVMNAGDCAYIENTGTVPIDLRLKAETTGWSLANSAGSDAALLMGLFDLESSPPASGEFETPTDVLSTVFKLSGSSDVNAFATSSSNGADISVDVGRYLYLYFQAPTTNSFNAQQSITVTVEAIPSS